MARNKDTLNNGRPSPTAASATVGVVEKLGNVLLGSQKPDHLGRSSRGGGIGGGNRCQFIFLEGIGISSFF
jgi:hypothetical protein